MEIREAEFFYGKQILIKFVYENMFLFSNYCQKVKSSFILNVDLDKSGIVYPFKPFCLFRDIHIEKFLVHI